MDRRASADRHLTAFPQKSPAKGERLTDTARKTAEEREADVATWDDVRALALALPETDESPSYGGLPAWRVKGRSFVWERPLGRADLAALGDRAPAGPVLGVHVADVGVKDALVADEPAVFFTTPHFDGYAAVLVQLDRVAVDELTEIMREAWLLRAPRRLVRAHPELSRPT